MPLREHVSTGGTHGVVELKDAVKMGCFTTVLAAVLMCGIHTIYIVYIWYIYIYICMDMYGIYGVYGLWYIWYTYRYMDIWYMVSVSFFQMDLNILA